MSEVQSHERTEKRTELRAERAMALEGLIENVSGVMHNMKSTLMAVNGYIDLFLCQKSAGGYFRFGGSIGRFHHCRFSSLSPKIAISELTTRAQTNCVLFFLLILANMVTIPSAFSCVAGPS